MYNHARLCIHCHNIILLLSVSGYSCALFFCMELKLACSHVGPHSQLSMLFKAKLALSLSMGLSLVVVNMAWLVM